MKKQITLYFILFLNIYALSAQHKNILIDANPSADEPSIALDPRNTNRIVAGSNIDNIYYSTDAGHSWTKKQQNSTFGVYGDPVIICDRDGTPPIIFMPSILTHVR